MTNVKGKYLAKYKTLLLSTGVSSLDNLLNGGLATPTITLLEEDNNNVHCSLLCQHFVSVGLSNCQDTGLVIDDTLPEQYLNNLPKIVSVDASVARVGDNISDLNIAWRYKQMRSVEDDFVSSKSNGSSVGVNDVSRFSSHLLAREKLSDNLVDALRFCEQFIKEKGGLRKPLRLVISSLGSPIWGTFANRKDYMVEIFRFLFCLRKLISTTTMSVVVTMSPDALYGHEARTTSRFHTVADYVFKFESFADPKAVGDQLFNDITGQLKPIKIPCINSIEPILRPNTLVWSYHVRRTKMLFKEFTLPPCLSDNTSRSNQNEPSRSINTNVGCGVDF